MNKSSSENDLDNKWNCFDENETLGQKDGQRVEDDEILGMLSVVQMIYTS